MFFSAAGLGTEAKFIYQDEVQKWLDLIRGSFLETTLDNLKLGAEAVKKAKKEANVRELSDKEKNELSEEEKQYKTLRRQIQERLVKFATRIPVFMYLTDYRERCLKDIITQLEPGLFKRVTGLTIKDFSSG